MARITIEVDTDDASSLNGAYALLDLIIHTDKTAPQQIFGGPFDEPGVYTTSTQPPVDLPAPQSFPPIPPPPISYSAPVEFDSNGMPWDERIHASSKNKLKNGTWRYKKGLEDIDVVKIEAELRSKYPAPSADVVAAGASSAAAVQEVVETASAVQPQEFGFVMPPPPPPPSSFITAVQPEQDAQPVTTAVPPPPAAPLSLADARLKVTKIINSINQGKITKDQVNAILAGYGLTGLPELLKNQQYLEAVSTDVEMITAMA